MKASKLAELLLKNPEMEVMILDGFNGGGIPRTINLGPITETISENHAKEAADCEGKIGQEILVLGYGNY